MSLHLLAGALALALAVLPCEAASAQSASVGSLSVTDAWTRATPPGAPTGAGYLSITNKGTTADRLTAVAIQGANRGELHEMSVANGIMTMRPLAGGIEIQAGRTVALAPSGFHMMFVGLKDGFKEGQKLTVTLTFEKAGKVDVSMPVLALGAPAPKAGGAMDHMTMPEKQP